MCVHSYVNDAFARHVGMTREAVEETIIRVPWAFL
jgi:hypothetical protein